MGLRIIGRNGMAALGSLNRQEQNRFACIAIGLDPKNISSQNVGPLRSSAAAISKARQSSGIAICFCASQVPTMSSFSQRPEEASEESAGKRLTYRWINAQ
jgi:hypothetical protein